MMNAPKSRWIIIGIIAALLAGAGYVVLPVFFSVSHKTREIFQLARLKELGIALKTYADGNGGKFPDHISDLPAESVPGNDRKFHDPVSDQPSDWIYFSGRTTSDPGDTILAASPVKVFSRKRIVISVDTAASVVDEAEFQRMISVQPPHR